ncbi:hypothetical protein R69746_05653 [Paraburkholderia aspalathi]|nr:hypothetical protein R69746_05653 [Paraburkholderia aspalathi]
MTTQRLKKAPISFRVNDETKRKLEELAAVENRTITNYLETVIDKLYEEIKRPKKRS